MARILVVDDDRSSQSAIRDVLEKEGHEVAVAGETESALRHIASSAFDLVITDVRMPGKSGIDLLVELRRCQLKVPVMMISAFGDRATTTEAMHLGACDFLSKPLRRRELVERITKALGG